MIWRGRPPSRRWPVPPCRAFGPPWKTPRPRSIAADVDRLAAALPASEQWRLFEAFGADAAYLDIETGDDVWGRQGISAIGILDRLGPHPCSWAGGTCTFFPSWPAAGVSSSPSTASRSTCRSCGGRSPDWTPPACHIDLRHVLARLGHPRWPQTHRARDHRAAPGAPVASPRDRWLGRLRALSPGPGGRRRSSAPVRRIQPLRRHQPAHPDGVRLQRAGGRRDRPRAGLAPLGFSGVRSGRGDVLYDVSKEAPSDPRRFRARTGRCRP